jgi:hypothetical protein
MTECVVCFEPRAIVRHFMPCACTVALCDECCSSIRRCVWCRASPPPFLAEDETDESTEEERLRAEVRDVRWQNTLLRVEHYHFKRHARYQLCGFYTGFIAGLGAAIACVVGAGAIM